MTVIDDLKAAGVPAKLKPAATAGDVAVLVISVNARTVRFAVLRKGRAPYPSEFFQLEAAKQALGRRRPPLLLAPKISAPLGRLLTDHGWSWADERGSYDIRHGNIVLRQTVAAELPLSRPRTGIPQGRGSLAMVRRLLSAADSSKPVTATGLASLVGGSQAAASQLLGALEDLDAVERKGRSAWTAKREALLDQFLASYAGPRGAEQYAYTLESLHDAAGAIVGVAMRENIKVLVSADVAPDIVNPWRVPTMVVIYANAPLDLSDLNLVAAHDRGSANIIVRIPRDTSIFDIGNTAASSNLPLADVPQMLWDLHDLGGSDREEAADKLRQWFLCH